ncbi:MAG: ABC transporter C-terminal domain-containing protein [Phycisphaerales bacterium]
MSQGKLESEIERIETRLKQIDREMAEPDVWSDHRKMTKLGDEREARFGARAAGV